ncbi:MAG TPA: Gfo/Idh/MocA family oxidoreductase [Pseudolabrys sp.]
MNNTGEHRLLFGIAGLGRAFTVMLPTFVGDERVKLEAAADIRAEARQLFAAEFAGKTYTSIDDLCADPSVEVVYVATPHQYHAQHAVLAARHGKHLLVEKPMALSLEDCAAIIEAVKRANVQLVVGHSHSFDAPVKHLRALIATGDFGRVRMINAFNYSDYLYRPRRPEELDTARGGGAVFNQGAHQVDIVRLIGGGRVSSVRAVTGDWDPKRPTEGAYAALMTFENGAFASLTYSGYGHFDSDEFENWLGEMGQKKSPYARSQRQRFADMESEISFKNAHNYGGTDYRPFPQHAVAHQHFGTLLVSCERGDLRATPNGVMIYRDGSARLDPLPAPTLPRREVIDELHAAIVQGTTPIHNGAWAMATLEVLLAMLRSAREGRDVPLRHQIGLP